MKKYLTHLLFSFLLLSALTSCNRSLRRDSNSEPTDQTAQDVSTSAAESMSVPVIESTATQSISTEVSTVQPTDTVVPTVAVSQSDIMADQLDILLGQFDRELQAVDIIPETP